MPLELVGLEPAIRSLCRPCAERPQRWAVARTLTWPETCCFLSGLPECPIQRTSDKRYGRKSRKLFSSPGPWNGNSIPPFTVYPSFSVPFLPNPAPEEERSGHMCVAPDSPASQRLCLPLAFFLKQKQINGQRVTGTFAERTSVRVWAPWLQKGSVAASLFSSPPCVSLLLTLTGSINATCRRSCYWKESLPPTSDMQVEACSSLVP